MNRVRLAYLALMWLTVDAYGQDAKKAVDFAGKLEVPLNGIACERREAAPDASLLQRMAPVAPTLKLAGERFPDQDRSPEMKQSEEKGPGISLKFGMDLVSRFVWRGIDLGDAPAFQPYASVSLAGFEFGAWGSYAFGAPAGAPPFSEYRLVSTVFGYHIRG